jgi:hypothetical protein
VYLTSQGIQRQYLGATTTTRGRRHHRSLHIFHYGGLRRRSLCARLHGLSLGKGSGLLNSWRRVLLSSCCTRFLSFPGQIGGFPAQCKFGGQPSKTTKLHVLLGDGFHLQAGPDYSHGRSAKYTGNINKPSFCGRLLFSLDCYWFFGSSSRGGFWPAFFCRRLRLGSTRRLLCHPRHGLFYGGGWTTIPLSRSSHCIPVVFFPLICGVGRWNLLPLDCQHAIHQDKYTTTLLEELTS